MVKNYYRDYLTEISRAPLLNSNRFNFSSKTSPSRETSKVSRVYTPSHSSTSYPSSYYPTVNYDYRNISYPSSRIYYPSYTYTPYIRSPSYAYYGTTSPYYYTSREVPISSTTYSSIRTVAPPYRSSIPVDLKVTIRPGSVRTYII